MSENNSTDGFRKSRPVLADVTNRPGKRTFSLVSGDSTIKSGDGYVKNVDDNEGDSMLSKQVCLGVENLVNEKWISECVERACEKVFSSFNRKKSFGLPIIGSGTDSGVKNIASATLDIPSEVNELPNLLDASLGVARADNGVHSVIEIGDASRDSCVSSYGDCNGIGGSTQEDEGKVASSVTLINLAHEVSDTNICGNDGKDLSTSNLTSSKYGSIDCSRLAKSSGSKFFELERCTASKGNGGFNSSANLDSIKACSCSFCLKAAYILSDLHYQDIKGRIAASKKSQKDASTLVQRCRLKESNTHGHGNSNKSLKLEHDLMGQWRSLFLHMEDKFGSESDQLQESYLTLKELRENCKTNLEMIKGIPSDKELCASGDCKIVW